MFKIVTCHTRPLKLLLYFLFFLAYNIIYLFIMLIVKCLFLLIRRKVPQNWGGEVSLPILFIDVSKGAFTSARTKTGAKKYLLNEFG